MRFGHASTLHRRLCAAMHKISEYVDKMACKGLDPQSGIGRQPDHRAARPFLSGSRVKI